MTAAGQVYAEISFHLCSFSFCSSYMCTTSPILKHTHRPCTFSSNLAPYWAPPLPRFACRNP